MLKISNTQIQKLKQNKKEKKRKDRVFFSSSEVVNKIWNVVIFTFLGLKFIYFLIHKTHYCQS